MLDARRGLLIRCYASLDDEQLLDLSLEHNEDVSLNDDAVAALTALKSASPVARAPSPNVGLISNFSAQARGVIPEDPVLRGIRLATLRQPFDLRH